MPFLLPLSLHLGASTYTVEGLPVAGATLLGVASTVVIVFALRRAMATRYALLGGLLVLSASALLGAVWLVMARHGDLSRLLGPFSPDALESVLLGPLLLEHGAVVLSLASVLVAFGAMARQQRGSLWALASLLLGGASLPVIGHILVWERMSRLPRGTIAGPPHIQVGRSRAVIPRLVGESGVAGYRLSASAKEIVATERGTYPVTIRAVGPLLTVETVATVTAVEERASPLMELRDGEGATYAGETRCTYAGGRTTSYPNEFWYSVTSTGERDGLAMFRVTTSLRRSFDAYAADGETYLRHPAPTDDAVEPAVKWERSAGSTCTLAAISIPHAATCRTSPERIEAFEIRGGTGTAQRVVLGLLTLGMHVPESSECTSTLSYAGVIRKARGAD